ncbi:MAG: bifunctional pyr operon transcriptional regulator/uracil phosphoribosyltransferase PyrR [Bacteroidetes bacterium]|nr:bifunctional pyr operon transcriptional regulator/uracil phosphoribosyltransferase PyrR [Bacteroidota bacterium]
MNLRIMSAQQVERTMIRLAYEVVERNRGASNITIFGILRAGARLARFLAAQIGEIEQLKIPLYDLDTTAFRDDTDRTAPDQDYGSDDDIDVTDRDVILVDDVLFTGRTVRAALDAVVRYGRPRSVQLMVLIDRGHREYPIQPDYVGKTIPTRHKETVVVDTDPDITVSVVE